MQTTSMYSILIVLASCLISAVGAIFLKKSTKTITFKIKSFTHNRLLIIGAALYSLSTILFVPALKNGELSVLYPLVSTTYIWVIILSYKFLKEHINIYKLIGIIVIIVGVVLMGIAT